MLRIGVTERGDAALDTSWLLKDKDVDGTISGMILITKNPGKLYNILMQIRPKCPLVIHCTITGWGGTPVEPFVPGAKLALEGYRQLLAEFPNDRVVLRVDPVILCQEGGLALAKNVITWAPEKSRIRISFMDAYPHVRKRMENRIHLSYPGFHSPYPMRKDAFDQLQEKAKSPIEVCGEPGFPCTGCVSTRDLKAMGLAIPENLGKSYQRSTCACIASKTEMFTTRKPCKHGCIYCYWKNEKE